MSAAHRLKLEQLGLSAGEARVYLTVLIHGPLPASAIASQTGIARTSVYPTICSLAEMGLIEGGVGHGSKFTAVAPALALNGLVVREKEVLAERQQIAKELAQALGPLAADTESALDDSVQVIRTPQLLGERFQRLQLETKRLVECVVKAPIFTPQGSNPAQQKARRRGVHYKGLYERAAIEAPDVQPFIEGWLAGGEDARVYDGIVPTKMAIFDQEIVLTVLSRHSGHPAAMLVRNEPFARSMSILFDYFWQQSKPLTAPNALSAPKNNIRRAGRGNSQTSGRQRNRGKHINPRSVR